MSITETEQLVDRALDLLDQVNNVSTPDKKTKEYHTYHLEIPDDIHWILVALGAGSRQHQEDYAEKVLIEYAVLCYERMAAMDTIEKEKEQ